MKNRSIKESPRIFIAGRKGGGHTNPAPEAKPMMLKAREQYRKELAEVRHEGPGAVFRNVLLPQSIVAQAAKKAEDAERPAGMRKKPPQTSKGPLLPTNWRRK